MHRTLLMPIRFAAIHRRVLHSVFTLLWLSGVLWLAFHYFLRVPGEFGAVAHPAEIWWLRLHGLMGFGALVILGSVLPVHMRRAWHLKKNRASGLAMNSIFVWLAATGYALYYFASEANAAWLPHLHWIIGLALPVTLIFHIRRGRAQLASAHHPLNTYVFHKQPASSTPFSVASQPTLGNLSERNVANEPSTL